jgi:hypothetical protein
MSAAALPYLPIYCKRSQRGLFAFILKIVEGDLVLILFVAGFFFFKAEKSCLAMVVLSE